MITRELTLKKDRGWVCDCPTCNAECRFLLGPNAELETRCLECKTVVTLSRETKSATFNVG